jgi:hypothetical protein
MAIIDTLKLARALRDKGGFSQEAADATAQALNDALGADVATKSDIQLLRGDLDREIAVLKSDINRLDGKMTVLMWAVGVNAALTIAILGILLHH